MGATKTLKRLFNAKKAGHGGTLDPLATGLLPIALGKTTGFIPYLMMWPKTYEFSLQWGASSTSDDALGVITPHEESLFPSRQHVEDLLVRDFHGKVMQRPPYYCARRVDGQRAYTLSLQGILPDLQERPVMLYSTKLLHYDDQKKTMALDVTCSSGTYVRSIARDIGTYFQSRCYVTALRRTSIGPFSVSDHGIPWSHVQEWQRDNPQEYFDTLHDPEVVLPPIVNTYDVTPEDIQKLWCGTWIPFSPEGILPSKKHPGDFSWVQWNNQGHHEEAPPKDIHNIYGCYGIPKDGKRRCVALCTLEDEYLKPYRCFYTPEDLL